MIELNLQTKTAEQEAIKSYLQENVSATLADKINKGVATSVDGKALINRKDLDGFIKYACEEAKKQAEKDARCACIRSDTVFGWAIHYFEEDSIIGSLYYCDGTEYKPEPKAAPKTTPTAVKVKEPQNTNFQLSLFNTSEEELEDNPRSQLITEDGEIIDCEEVEEDIEEEIEEEIEEVVTAPKTPLQIPQGNLLYQSYMRIQDAYPKSVIALKLGDFYEVFGDNAVRLADEFNLTLTSRELGLPSRVPMIGFPYHSAELYFNKIRAKYDLVIDESDYGIETKHLPQKEPETPKVDDVIMSKLKALFGSDMEVRL
ncbi:MAG: hypothetical protein EOM87_07565 [Clostridia bacterium]|nr:hypothetical protein [Clostridia bacterium]